jgi:hypothetical protein
MAFCDPVHYDKVVLIPICDAGQGRILKTTGSVVVHTVRRIKTHFDGHAAVADVLGGVHDAACGNALAAELAAVAQVGQGVFSTMTRRDHQETGRATVHGVALAAEGEGRHGLSLCFG